jgi:hypothetical protein
MVTLLVISSHVVGVRCQSGAPGRFLRYSGRTQHPSGARIHGIHPSNAIGKDVIFDGNSHPSILKIKNNTFFLSKGSFFYVVEQPELLLTWLEKHWF